MDIYNLTANELKRAAATKERIERLNRELNAIFGERATSGAAPKKNRMSASVRRKIAAAQRARWASLRQAKTAPSGERATKKKVMSPAARKKLSAKLKAYWAKKKAGNK
jgi:hypothetical protein